MTNLVDRAFDEREHLRIVAWVDQDGDPKTISSAAWSALS
jgi:hypothetical protein